MACEGWKIRVSMRKAKSFDELVEYISDEFPDVKVLNKISEKRSSYSEPIPLNTPERSWEGISMVIQCFL